MFDAQIPRSSPALMQHPAFAAALRLVGETPVILPSGLVLLSRRIAGVPVLMMPRATPPPDLGAQLYAAGLHRRPLILSPERPCSMPVALKVAAPQTLLMLDLTPSTAMRRAGLHQKWRHQLGQAERADMRIIRRPLTPDHPLLAQEDRHAHEKRYRNWPRALTAAFAQAAPEQAQVFTANLRGYPVAHMLFLTHGSRATYHIGHTTAQGRGIHAHNLILWEATAWLAKAGHCTLDLGREIDGQANLNRFKRRAGGRPQHTGGTWLRWSPLAGRRMA